VQAERWKKVEELFDAAQRQPANQRAEFLRHACPHDAELCAEVETLLKAAESRDQLLDGSPLSSVAERAPALKPGDKLGSFQIVALIGRGGMGEAYRARDLRLKREVAIKTLPPGFAADQDRIARLEHEARASSTLNHPNIVGIHEIGSAAGVSFIVSELVDGETLARVIERGPVPLRKLVEVSTQICDGLAAAHSAGVIHRDLKPGNVMLTRDGRVKILDFGLAHRGRGSGLDSTTTKESEPGMIMGTPGYMSPEQVRGETTDARSDLFSVGVILYEMASGQRPFRGASSIEVMNAILKDEPPELSPASPHALDRIVRRCIEKEPARRFQSAADLGFAIRSLSEVTAAEVPSKTGHKRLLAAGLVLAIAAALGAWWLLKPRPDTKAGQLVLMPLTSVPGWEECPSISPDGNQVAYMQDQANNGASFHIFVKLIGEGKPMQLTSGTNLDYCPSWSPDGRSIAFIRLHDVNDPNESIYTIPALGGAERQVAQGRFSWGVAWSPDGRFLAVREQRPQAESFSLSLIAVENGEKLDLTKTPDARTSDKNPLFSEDGRLLLFTRCRAFYHCGLYLLDLAAGYRPSGAPRLLRQERGLIEGSTWTADSGEVVYALSEDVDYNFHLMRIPAHAGAQPQRLPLTSEQIGWPTIAPHRDRLVYVQLLVDVDIWQVQPGKPPRSFASSRRMEFSPQYSPDGRRVAFASNRSGLTQIWTSDQDVGNPAQLTHFDSGHSGTPRWSPDGHWIVFDHQENEWWRIYVMASDGGQVRRVAQDEGDENLPSWSSDGEWIYSTANRSGRYEIWKRPARGGKALQVTQNGGWVAFESHDGKSLYFNKSGNSGLWVLPLRGGEEKQLLKSAWFANFAVVDDGIYYMPAPEPNSNSSVRFLSFATGRDKEIAPIISAPHQGLAVSPDRKTILYATNVRSGSSIMVVDNFR
jgi:eukaryotic-like serine/threonine-protein kinase